jgi:hypothetical protein
LAYYLFDVKGWPQVVKDADRHLYESSFVLLGTYSTPQAVAAAYDSEVEIALAALRQQARVDDSGLPPGEDPPAG